VFEKDGVYYINFKAKDMKKQVFIKGMKMRNRSKF